ncbi:MAG: LytS/YhcK type 5TM receptor domain-containing protein [Desulfuromonadaceae bacterium]|nr:LytS/YhcK type 5TM receptor domain-containing protein [Desulfuromonadaceae bacterium]
MGKNILVGLIENAALLMSLGLIYDIFCQSKKNRNTIIYKVGTGAVIGAVVIVLMTIPLKLDAGIIFDTRSIILGLTGLFFGTVPTLCAMVISLLYRVSLGGAGAQMGVATIITSCLTGLIWRYYRSKVSRSFSLNELYIFGVAVHLLMVACMLLLPRDLAVKTFYSVALPIMLVYPLATVLLGNLLLSRQNRFRIEDELSYTNELFMLFMKHSPIYSFIQEVTPTDSRVFQSSENYKDMIGIAGSKMAGKSIKELFPSELAEKIIADNWEVVSKGEVLTLEEELNGRSYTSIKFPIVIGEKTLLAGYTIDITDRKMHEKEQLKIEKLESLGILAGGIAHDFNNILTGVIGNISFAQRFIDSTHKSYKPLIEADKASVRAGELAHQLLTFARGGEPVKKVVSVQHIVNETVSLALHGSNVKGVVDVSSDIHAIEADEGQLSQVLHNLIINATQAMPAGGELKIFAENVSLDIGNSVSLHSGSYIRLSIVDKGCGIPEKIIKNIFDPYFTTKAAGNGLGLASVQSIIIRHGGQITVTSVVDKGTTFTIYLPSIGETYLQHENDSKKLAEVNHKGASILVMDDEEMIRDMTSGMLEFMEYKPVVCENGDEAVKEFTAARDSGNPFSAVIMDLTIPGGMGGREAAARILSIDPKACLIVSSGYSNDTIMSDYGAYGFSAAISKPYKIDDLGKLLSLLLSKVET